MNELDSFWPLKGSHPFTSNHLNRAWSKNSWIVRSLQVQISSYGISVLSKLISAMLVLKELN
jgi:hypothetical protein